MVELTYDIITIPIQTKRHLVLRIPNKKNPLTPHDRLAAALGPLEVIRLATMLGCTNWQ